MNQKQRDYLIKRLEKIKDEKIAGYHIDEPDPKPFIKMLKTARIVSIIDRMNKEFGNITNKTESGYYVGKGYGNYVNGTKIIGLYSINSVTIKPEEYYTNLSKVREKYAEHCKKHYQKETDRHEAIEREYVKMCDQIVFAEDYKEAAKLIEQFLKF